MADSDGSAAHTPQPYRGADKRVRCRPCGAFVVGTPAGWFHTPEPAAADIGSSEQVTDA